MEGLTSFSVFLQQQQDSGELFEDLFWEALRTYLNQSFIPNAKKTYLCTLLSVWAREDPKPLKKEIIEERKQSFTQIQIQFSTFFANFFDKDLRGTSNESIRRTYQGNVQYILEQILNLQNTLKVALSEDAIDDVFGLVNSTCIGMNLLDTVNHVLFADNVPIINFTLEDANDSVHHLKGTWLEMKHDMLAELNMFSDSDNET